LGNHSGIIWGIIGVVSIILGIIGKKKRIAIKNNWKILGIMIVEVE